MIRTKAPCIFFGKDKNYRNGDKICYLQDNNNHGHNTYAIEQDTDRGNNPNKVHPDANTSRTMLFQ